MVSFQDARDKWWRLTQQWKLLLARASFCFFTIVIFQVNRQTMPQDRKKYNNTNQQTNAPTQHDDDNKIDEIQFNSIATAMGSSNIINKYWCLRR